MKVPARPITTRCVPRLGEPLPPVRDRKANARSTLPWLARGGRRPRFPRNMCAGRGGAHIRWPTNERPSTPPSQFPPFERQGRAEDPVARRHSMGSQDLRAARQTADRVAVAPPHSRRHRCRPQHTVTRASNAVPSAAPRCRSRTMTGIAFGWRLPSWVVMSLASVLAAQPTTTDAWCNESHRLFGEIAETRLSMSARSEMERLLAQEPGATLVLVSTWPDDDPIT